MSLKATCFYKTVRLNELASDFFKKKFTSVINKKKAPNRQSLHVQKKDINQIFFNLKT